MKRESGTISREAILEPGAEYEALRTEAIAMVQSMAGDIWTDYNYSDPGVTIIEQLAYALTELSYRASLPVADILAEPNGDRLQLHRHGLFPASSILTCNPVTIADIRRLIIDRVAGVANIWIEPDRTRECEDNVAGLYSMSILPCPGDHDPSELIGEVRRCYVAHRALCEDVGHIEILKPERTIVEARIDIAHDTDPSEALAQSFFTLGLALAPEPARLSLAQWQQAKPLTTEVFSGPLLTRGFIADDQLSQNLFDGTAHQLTELLASTTGVLVVDSLKVKIGDQRHYRIGNDQVKAEQGRYLKLETGTGHLLSQDGFSISIYRDSQKCEPAPHLVHRKLAALWKEHRKTWPLQKEIADCYGAPDCQYDDLASYTSVQTQFPAVYGVGNDGLFDGASTQRRGQAKQLKGYLMPFDQLLADYFAQLAFIRELFSVKAGGKKTYAWQSLRPIVPDAGPLLLDDYEARLANIVAQTDPVTRRRNEILDLLLSFQGLALSVSVPSSNDPRVSEATAAIEIKAKQVLLRQAAEATRDRGRGVDYLHHHHARSMAGAELLSHIELGLLNEELKTHLTPPDRWDDSEDRHGHLLEGDEWRRYEHQFRSIEFEEYDEHHSSHESYENLVVTEELLTELHRSEDYLVGVSLVEEVHVVIFRDSRGRWWIIAEFEDEDEAIFIVAEIHRHARRRHRFHQDLYLVEWVLLRHGETDHHRHDRDHHHRHDDHHHHDSDDHRHDHHHREHHDHHHRHDHHEHDGRARCPDRFNFRITAVVAATREERDITGWKEKVKDIVGNNTPAHIALECLFLERRHLREFEDLFFAWRRALREPSRHSIAETSRRLEFFLLRHLPDPDPFDPCKPPTPSPTPAPSPPAPPDPPTPPTPAPTPVPPVPHPPTPAPVPPDPPEESWWKRMFHWLWNAVKTILWGLLKIVTLGAIGVGIYEFVKDIWGFLKNRGVDPLPDPPDHPDPPAIPPPPFPWFPPPAVDPETAIADVGQKGFDVDMVLESASLDAFHTQGFRFAIRYVRNTNSSNTGNLTKEEADLIRSGGFALMPVQHARSAGWRPTQELGQEDGALAVQQVFDCALPSGICVWLDLQNIYGDPTAADIMSYCSAWFTQVSDGGYRPGLYVGTNCGLSQDELDNQLPFAYYWRSGSNVPDLPNHGYCMVQLIDSQYVIDGVNYDLDTIVDDSNSEPPVWATPISTQPTAPVSPPPPPTPIMPPVPVAPPPSPPPSVNTDTAVAVIGQNGFDSNTVMETSSLDAFYAKGFRFAVRYVRNTNSSTSGNLNKGEADTIRSAGFALMAVQHVRGSGWRPTGELGQQDGALAVQQVLDCGLPQRICVWMDLEGVYGDATSDDVIAYCNAWHKEVANGGFLPGIYVGASCGLTQDQLDNDLPFAYYWRSGSNVPDLPDHGYCMVQLIDSNYVIDGVSYDLDTVVDDSNSAPPVWAAPFPER